jgi:hypothetical protein
MIQDVTRTAVAMELMGKHVSTKKNSRNNKRDVFSVRSVSIYYKENKDFLSQLSFETPAYQDKNNLGPEELNRELREFPELAVSRIIEKKWQERN